MVVFILSVALSGISTNGEQITIMINIVRQEFASPSIYIDMLDKIQMIVCRLWQKIKID